MRDSLRRAERGRSASEYAQFAIAVGLWHRTRMATRVREALMRELGGLRYEPIDKRIRATLGGREVIDSTRAMLVWEPKRVVPSYAVPIDDVDGELRGAWGRRQDLPTA